MQHNNLPPELYTGHQLLRIQDVADLTSLSRSYIYELAAQRRFPRSVPLVPGGTARAWVGAEIKQWIEDRIAERDMEV
jgi:prophage regulatory protein